VAEFRMPALGADMDEGTLVEWLVKPGDQIHKGDIIAVVDTAKSAIEVESFHTGTIAELITPAGETVPVGTVLATITEAGAEAGGTGAAEPGVLAVSAQATAADPAAAGPGEPAAGEARKGRRAPGKRAPGRARPARKPAPPGPGAPARSTPLVRHEAAQLGVDLATVHGTGPGRPSGLSPCGRRSPD
jgi:pyruvate dehydrogenase E2 component (dihydrolipoamide acetyltransferase)